VRILVAGGAGFVGSHVCRTLTEQQHEVVCIDNLISGWMFNIEKLVGLPNFEFIEADVANPPPIARIDLVLHLASPASPVDYQKHPIETMLANSQGTLRLLDIAVENHARFLFASTSEVYGDPLQHPQTEEYWGNVNPNGPRACYDESKRFGEALTWEYRRKFGVDATIVRIFNTYGPYMKANDGRVVPAFVGAALAGQPLPVHGDGTQTRSFCYVSDLVDGLLRVALDPSADGEVFNLGNPHEVTMLELAQTVMSVSGGYGDIVLKERQQDDPERRRPDITKVRSRYGWGPKVSLEDGLGHTVEYFRGVLAAQAARS
jgi:nucleoside-diphosphate-sugar epimerase